VTDLCHFTLHGMPCCLTT